MSDGVSTSSNAIHQAILQCESVEEFIREESARILKQFHSAGANWRDQKYKEVERAVNDAVKFLQAPTKELKACRTKLTELKKIVDEYESL